MTEPRPADPTLRIGVLISGGGTTLENLIACIRGRRTRGVEIGLVVSSRAAVRGVEIARQAGLPTVIVRPRDYPTPDAFDASVADVLDQHAVQLVVMGGFLALWRFPPRYNQRVINIHPALLPKYGGRGMYGHHVHAAVLAAGERESGCTVHLVDHEYDHGPIVAQARVPVQSGDTPDTLAARVGQAERELYPQVIQSVADHGLGWLEQFTPRR